MIIRSARKVRTANPAAYAWAGLRKFQNADLITDELIKLHNLPAKWHGDAKKQAQQIRYCINQAREYFVAAQAVSLATKPNLLYYGTMSLALAEILYKQTGDSSLDKAREQHRHHGLSMTAGNSARDADLATAASHIRATPVEVNGSRKGTFELWHRSCREHPIAGNLRTQHEAGGGTNSFRVLFGALDVPFKPVAANGLTLWACLQQLPLMFDHLSASGYACPIVRGKVEEQQWEGAQWRTVQTLTLHPSLFVEALVNDIKIDAKEIEKVNVAPISQGYHLTINNDWINGVCKINLPQATMFNSEEVRFWVGEQSLNEFGYFYAALFLAGNYARYYPDRWLLDVERSNPLAMALEELCSISEWRMPWLALSELGRNLLVVEA